MNNEASDRGSFKDPLGEKRDLLHIFRRSISLQPLRDWRAVRTIARSGLFDREWYLKSYPDVAARGIDPVRHYVAYGAREGRDPSPSFSTRGYLSRSRDVAVAEVNPLEHFVRHGAAEGRKPHPLFHCSDLEWLAILRRSVTEEVIQDVKFPRFPDTILQSNFVGSANENALEEAYNFYSLLKDRSTKLNSPITGASRILDFGCGWGRFLRFFWKDVSVANLHGVDVDPDIIEVCRNTAVPGTFYELKANGRLPFPDGYFSHVLAYSVFTHLPERVHLHWLAEIARVMQPQATFCLTLQPRRFLDFVAELDESTAESSWHKNLRRFANSVVPSKQAYDSGQFVYLPSGAGNYRGTDVYGEAVVPLPYIEKNWKKYLHISEYIDDPARFWQAVLIAQKPKQGPIGSLTRQLLRFGDLVRGHPLCC